ncbi:MAG: Bax inhibitor-1/YccA family protein [Planctomycetes bacterium]|nr:Bax inhibitor-1/YccA family protein [Planctomycetota bacterium]
MSNPILSEKRWNEELETTSGGDVMTVDGAAIKTSFLVLIMLAVIAGMWSQFWAGQATPFQQLKGYAIGGGIGGLVLVLIGMFLPRFSAVLSIAYSICQGLLLGAITMIFEVAYPGLPLLAATFTSGTLLGMLMLYKFGIIKASSGFMRGVMGATAGLALGVGMLFLLNMFGIGTGMRATLYGNGPIGIGFSVFCVILAALNLVVDFGMIEEGARRRAPKYMEWVGAFGLMVTLVWLYIEILRLLAKLRR